MDIVYITLGLLLFCNAVIIIYLIYKCNKIYTENNLNKTMYLKKHNQLSMIEYQYRNYKEGKNPFTVLRDIGEILYYEEINDESK